jgi:hypothetical protein
VRGKPAGSVVRLGRFRWWSVDGDAPTLGMFLVSEAGSGYEIVGIEETARSGPECQPRVYNFMCVKTAPSAIPDGARVGSIAWEPRSRRT